MNTLFPPIDFSASSLAERIADTPKPAAVEAPVAWMYSKGDESFIQPNRANMNLRYWTETPLYAQPGALLPADVVRLVIAARIVAFEDQSPEALTELDRAVEAFAERVPWDTDPEALAAQAEDHP